MIGIKKNILYSASTTFLYMALMYLFINIFYLYRIILGGAYFRIPDITEAYKMNYLELFLAAVIFGPIIEEWLCRKLLLGFLRKFLTTWVAIALSSAAFSFFHSWTFNNTFEILNWKQYFSLFLMGINFSLIYLTTRKLLYPILSHQFVNLIALIPKPAPLFWPFFPHNQSNTYLFWIYVFALTVIVFLIIFGFRSGYIQAGLKTLSDSE